MTRDREFLGPTDGRTRKPKRFPRKAFRGRPQAEKKCEIWVAFVQMHRELTCRLCLLPRDLHLVRARTCQLTHRERERVSCSVQALQLPGSCVGGGGVAVGGTGRMRRHVRAMHPRSAAVVLWVRRFSCIRSQAFIHPAVRWWPPASHPGLGGALPLG